MENQGAEREVCMGRRGSSDRPEMAVRFGEERETLILQKLAVSHALNVSDLAVMLHVAEATVRRDLARLAKAGLIRRTHGGAMLLSAETAEIPLGIRVADRKREKNLIGRLAAEMVKDGDTIFMDSSSTILHMVTHLRSRVGLTVITNGLQTALDLSGCQGIRVFATGGLLREHARSFAGTTAIESIRRYTAGKAFFSCRAVDFELGMTDTDEEEAMIRREMLTCSREGILLADHEKFGDRKPFSICRWDRIHVLVTDRVPDLPESDVPWMKTIRIVAGDTSVRGLDMGT